MVRGSYSFLSSEYVPDRYQLVLFVTGGGFSNIIVSKPGTMLLDFMEPEPTIPEHLSDPNLMNDPAILSYAFAEIARAIGQHHIALMPDFFRPSKFTEIRLDDDQGWYIITCLLILFQ